MQKIVAGNWKMHGSHQQLGVIEELNERHENSDCTILICPPYPFLSLALSKAKTVLIGAQDCHYQDQGAFTGDISAPMLSSLGVSHVIVGHSERRQAYKETNDLVKAKAVAAQNAGLTPIICVGETLQERENGKARDVISEQLEDALPQNAHEADFIVAYEPVWAIGTGKIPSVEQITEIHALCREHLKNSFPSIAAHIPLLYGGSVKRTNAREIFSLDNVDGALVGGASLNANDFSPIIEALENT